MSNFDPRTRTRTLARIVGPYMLVLGVTLIVRQAFLIELMPAFMDDHALVFATGAFTLMAGLGLLAAHHHWTSASAALLSTIALAASVKGAWLLIAPEWGAEATAAIVAAPYALTAAAAFELAAGAWLTFAGWFARA